MSGEEEFSLIGGNFDFGFLKLSPLQRVERGHAQDLLFKTMKAYGFDQEKSKSHFTYDPYDLEDRIWKEDLTVCPDGTTREVLLYPSQTVKGLVFERVRGFVTETGETTDVRWHVVDEGPLLNFNPKMVFGRKPQVSL